MGSISGGALIREGGSMKIRMLVFSVAVLVAVGGTVSIPAGQTPGVYNGIFDITGTHNPAC